MNALSHGCPLIASEIGVIKQASQNNQNSAGPNVTAVIMSHCPTAFPIPKDVVSLNLTSSHPKALKFHPIS